MEGGLRGQEWGRREAASGSERREGQGPRTGDSEAEGQRGKRGAENGP